MFFRQLEFCAHYLTLSSGWSRLFFACLFGVLASLGQAPFHVFPLVIIAFTGLVWLLDGAVSENMHRSHYRTAFAIGFWFGFGYFVSGLYWLGHAFLVEAETFAILMPFAVAGLCAGLSLFYGFAAMLARSLWSVHAMRVVALAVSFTCFEWLRGNILTGFPWNAIGYAATFSDITAQGLSLIGIWAYTFCTVLIAATPAIFIDRNYKPLKYCVSCISIALIGGAIFFGVSQLNVADQIVENASKEPVIRVKVVQPNIDQSLIQRGQEQDRQVQFQSLLTLSASNQMSKTMPDLLVWPETAFPYLWEDRAELLLDIQALLQGKTVLVTGVHRKEAGGALGAKYYNSLYALDSAGAIHSVYDKNHLVPFGEYLPFQSFLESIGLEQITRKSGGFTAGSQREIINIGALPSFVPLICYEAIFSGHILKDEQRPKFLINITNDGWFGTSTGPYQHFHQVRMRAIETGLPIIRSANTGISAIIDPYGRVMHSLPLNRRGIVEGELPQALNETFYQTHKILIIILTIFSSLLFVLICKRYK